MTHKRCVRAARVSAWTAKETRLTADYVRQLTANIQQTGLPCRLIVMRAGTGIWTIVYIYNRLI